MSFGADIKKYRRMTINELTMEMHRIYDDPKNQNTDGSFQLHTKSAQKRLDLIGWAVRDKMFKDGQP